MHRLNQRLNCLSHTSAALLCALCLGLCTLTATAQSTTRKPWPRGEAGNTPTTSAPEQVVERATETVLPEAQATVQGAQGGLLDILARQKLDIVGSWLGTSGEGNKLINSFTSDGIIFGSVQGEVSTIPELGVLTPVHGVWTYLGGRQFAVTAIGILYDINTGVYLGYLKARPVLTLNEAGDEMSGTDKVEIFAPDGSLVFSASGKTSYKRIKAEPFN